MRKIEYVEAMIDTSVNHVICEKIGQLEQELPRNTTVKAVSDDCGDDEPTSEVSLVLVAPKETSDVQLERTGFLNAEEVAIVRLSDLKLLLAMRDELNRLVLVMEA